MNKVLKLFLILLGVAVMAYALLVAFVCIQEKAAAGMDVADPEAVIILGAQVRADGTPSVQLQWRLDTALEVLEDKQIPVVVCGAQGSDEPMTEAAMMRDYLISHGIDQEWILLDDTSFNTKQNLMHAAELLQEGSRVLIVTSDYHLPRALGIAKDLGLKAAGKGSPCKTEYWLKNHAREALAWVKYWGVKYLGLPLE